MPHPRINLIILFLSFPTVLLVAFIGFFLDIFPLPMGRNSAPETYHFMYGGWPSKPDEESLPEQLVGGGYHWLEASDRWIRFVSDDAQFLTLNPCNQEKIETKSRWFLRQAKSAQDRENLKDYANLTCEVDFMPFQEKEFLGIPPVPGGCSERWTIYHVPTQVVYARMRCAVW